MRSRQRTRSACTRCVRFWGRWSRRVLRCGSRCVRWVTEYSKYEGNNIVVKIQEYVEENYTDSNLNVNAIADVFQRNQKYISRIFKEETGVGLLTYINNFRVYKAQKLIQENKGTLEEIALQVGFNNARTFRRAWNRVNGDLPEG